ncbi:hypothetical protein F0U44_09895 [Nocardioides humilatus]|uniref:DUF11 domain-containing protein n=1 Tax=Nocardioides humilatus TaxID=2607660 RepID=A0A5B1LDI2_9ACTN|nr:hypothetical protein [Nocardioides humilatus]KAA1418793.1 hypothetical protein F0U44_09895 [Nocardioides humilatus]
MLTLRRARTSLLALAVFFACALVGLSPPAPASAEVTTGKVIIKGPGSGYSGPGGIVSEVVTAGGTATYQVRVVNFGDEPAQFVVKMKNEFLPATQTLHAGATNITASAVAPTGYLTPIIAPGSYRQLTLKVKTSVLPSQGRTRAEVTLETPGGTYLTFGWLYTMLKPPAHGNTAYQVYAKQGSQAYVGGHQVGQFATAPAVRPTGKAVFSVKFQNDGPSPEQIHGRMNLPSDCFTYTAEHRTEDVTEALTTGTWNTPLLPPGRSATIKITVELTGESCYGAFSLADIQASEWDGSGHNKVQILTPRVAT